MSEPPNSLIEFHAELLEDLKVILLRMPHVHWNDRTGFLGYRLWPENVSVIAGRLAEKGYRRITECKKCKYDSTSCDVKVFAPGLTYCSAGVPKEGKE